MPKYGDSRAMAEPGKPINFAANQALNVDGNTLELIADSDARLAAYLHLIGNARHSVDIIIYIFDADPAGEAVRAALLAATARGVAVRLVVDCFGANQTSAAFFEPLRQAGGAVLFFSRRWRSSYLIRNHQKMLIVDNDKLLIGGFNLAQSYFANDRVDGWADLCLVLHGPATAAAVDWFTRLYDFTCSADGKWLKLRQMMRSWQVANPPRGKLQWLVGGPTQRLSPWARAIRTDLAMARRVDMVMAYFSPGQGMLRRLGRAARRGSVRLVTAARSDNGATIGAARLLYGFLLRKRAAIFEYQPQRLHMKLIVADNAVYIGSANFDMRSLFVNLEMMLRIDDAALAAQARSLIDAMAAASQEITPHWVRGNASWLIRLRWFLSWFVVNTLDYSVVRRLNFGLETDPEAGQS